MTEKDEEIRNIIEKLDSKSPFDHFEEVINFIEDEENHKIIRKKNLISLFLHKRYLSNWSKSRLRWLNITTFVATFPITYCYCSTISIETCLNLNRILMQPTLNC